MNLTAVGPPVQTVVVPTTEEIAALIAKVPLPVSSYGPIRGKRCTATVLDSTGKPHDCGAKITSIDKTMICKCNIAFCRTHRQPQTHKCTFDHKAHRRAELSKQFTDKTCASSTNEKKPTTPLFKGPPS